MLIRNIAGIVVGVFFGKVFFSPDFGPLGMVLGGIFYLFSLGAALSIAMALIALSKVAKAALGLSLGLLTLGLFPLFPVNSSWWGWAAACGFSLMVYSMTRPHSSARKPSAGSSAGSDEGDMFSAMTSYPADPGNFALTRILSHWRR